MSRRLGLPLAPAALVLAAALGLIAGGRAAAAAPPLPVLGVDALAQGVVLENHDCAVQHWLERGISGAVLLHVDTHDALRPIDEGRMASLLALRDRGDFAAMAPKGCGGKTGLFNEGNFLRAAAGLGIVKEVVWVLPFTFLHEPGAEERLRRYLERAGFSAADAATFRLADAWYRGTLGGVPVTLCDQERLPPLAAPVVASIDADFFPFAASYRGLTLIAEIRVLFEALREARYVVRDAVFAYSVQGGFLPARLRWAGDAVVEILRDPAIALSPEPPGPWRDLQMLEVLRARGPEAWPQLLSMAFALLEAQPHDPALLLYAAEASTGHGQGERAIAYAEEACRVDRGYCVGLREIGLQFLDRGEIELGTQAFAAADRLLPGMAYGQLERGLALLRAGRAIDARRVFEEIRSREGAFPIGFLIGELQAAEGDREAMRRCFDEALAAMAGAPNVGVQGAVVAEAARRAAAFYRGEGRLAEAQALEADPRLRWSYVGEAP